MKNLSSIEDFKKSTENSLNESEVQTLSQKLSDIAAKKKELDLTIDELVAKSHQKEGDEKQLLELQILLKRRKLEDLDTYLKIARLKDRISKDKESGL